MQKYRKVINKQKQVLLYNKFGGSLTAISLGETLHLSLQCCPEVYFLICFRFLVSYCSFYRLLLPCTIKLVTSA